MGQSVQEIALNKLRLWTENPRDPMDEETSDAEIIRRALNNQSLNWSLDKMLDELGEYYYYNDLPTVVGRADGSYIVYDGNRRVAVLKCIQDPDLYMEAVGKIPTFIPPQTLIDQKSLPCNVCDQETALDIVEKYHEGSGKWGRLQFEYFLHIHRGQPKGRLLLVNEATDGLVESNPKLNEEYVQNGLLTDKNLNDIGFAVIDNELMGVHTNEESISILEDLAEVRNRDLSNARKNPRKLKDALIELNSEKYNEISSFDRGDTPKKIYPIKRNEEKQIVTRRTPLKKKRDVIFGGSLSVRGDRSNQIYRAIEDIYGSYAKKPEDKAYLLPVVGFSLRLLLETVAQEYYAAQYPKIDKGDDALDSFLQDIVKPHFRKQNDCRLLNQYSLASQWINGEKNLEATLHKWAHGTLRADNANILSHALLIAEVIKEFWWRA